MDLSDGSRALIPMTPAPSRSRRRRPTRRLLCAFPSTADARATRGRPARVSPARARVSVDAESLGGEATLSPRRLPPRAPLRRDKRGVPRGIKIGTRNSGAAAASENARTSARAHRLFSARFLFSGTQDWLRLVEVPFIIEQFNVLSYDSSNRPV